MMNNRMPLVFSWPSEKTYDLIVQALLDEKILITETDTVYGLLASLTEQSFHRLYKLKKRSSSQPFLILIGEKTPLSSFIDEKTLTPALIRLLTTCWPGPLTGIFHAKKSLPSWMISQNKTIALRCPDHKGLQKILITFSGLFSTSANLSGQPVPKRYEEIDKNLLAKCTYLVNNGNEAIYDEYDKKDIKPSTIIDFTSERPRIVREGAQNIIHLETIYGASFEK